MTQRLKALTKLRNRAHSRRQFSQLKQLRDNVQEEFHLQKLDSIKARWTRLRRIKEYRGISMYPD